LTSPQQWTDVAAADWVKAAADNRGHLAGQTLWVRVLVADPVYEPQLSQQLFKAAFVACPAVDTIMVRSGMRHKDGLLFFLSAWLVEP
jgi:hypothetical protein